MYEQVMAQTEAESYNELVKMLLQDETEESGDVIAQEENPKDIEYKPPNKTLKNSSKKVKKAKIEKMATLTSSIAPIPTNPSQLDVRSYVAEVFENIIAPNIIGATPTTSHIRRMIYRRALLENAETEARLLSTITPEDIFDICLSSIRKSGLMLL